MGIKDRIETVRREFIGGDVLLAAVLIQEDVSAYQAASWFMRWIERLNTIPMLAYNDERQDFYAIDPPWAGDVFGDILHPRDPEGISWDENGDGYIGGWLSSDLKRFFSGTEVLYPEAAIASVERVPRLQGNASEGCAGYGAVPAAEIEQSPYPARTDAATEGPIGTRERNTLLAIIATLAKEAGDLLRLFRANHSWRTARLGVG